jgi:hypothetical protein
VTITIIREDSEVWTYRDMNPADVCGPFDVCDVCGDDLELHEEVTYERKTGKIVACDRS